YRDGEAQADWLARYGVGAGNIEPAKVPYYLLLVGSPEEIPYSFQYQLELSQTGVQRLIFPDQIFVRLSQRSHSLPA
ncbi:MAG: hypothetical protein HGA45_40540, partial [Chloroflexales bacterium]|nr:hypothetical protein [Chloroflexales bacterium]